MYSYELDIDLGDEVGAIRASGIRDYVAAMMDEAVMGEETFEVEMVSEREIRVRLSTPFDLIENDAKALKDAVLEALYENMSASEMASVGSFRMIDCPKPAFLN